jgi:hypothetical protein
MRKQNARTLAISVFVMAITFFNFTRLTGCDCIRAIHIVNLLVCGMGIGIFITNLFALLKKPGNYHYAHQS